MNYKQQIGRTTPQLSPLALRLSSRKRDIHTLSRQSHKIKQAQVNTLSALLALKYIDFLTYIAVLLTSVCAYIQISVPGFTAYIISKVKSKAIGSLHSLEKIHLRRLLSFIYKRWQARGSGFLYGKNESNESLSCEARQWQSLPRQRLVLRRGSPMKPKGACARTKSIR